MFMSRFAIKNLAGNESRNHAVKAGSNSIYSIRERGGVVLIRETPLIKRRRAKYQSSVRLRMQMKDLALEASAKRGEERAVIYRRIRALCVEANRLWPEGKPGPDNVESKANAC